MTKRQKEVWQSYKEWLIKNPAASQSKFFQDTGIAPGTFLLARKAAQGDDSGKEKKKRKTYTRKPKMFTVPVEDIGPRKEEKLFVIVTTAKGLSGVLEALR